MANESPKYPSTSDRFLAYISADRVGRDELLRSRRPALPESTTKALDFALSIKEARGTEIGDNGAVEILHNWDNQEMLAGLLVGMVQGLGLPQPQMLELTHLGERNALIEKFIAKWQEAKDKLGITPDTEENVSKYIATFQDVVKRAQVIGAGTDYVAAQSAIDEACGELIRNTNTEPMMDVYKERLRSAQILAIECQTKIRAIQGLLASKDGESGRFLVDRDSAFAFAEAILHILNNPREFQKYQAPVSTGGFERIKMWWEYVVDKKHSAEYAAVGRGFFTPAELAFLQKDHILRGILCQSIVVLLYDRLSQAHVQNLWNIVLSEESGKNREALQRQIAALKARSTVDGIVKGTSVTLGVAVEEHRQFVFELDNFIDNLKAFLTIASGSTIPVQTPEYLKEQYAQVLTRSGQTQGDGGQFLSDMSQLQALVVERDEKRKRLAELTKQQKEVEAGLIAALNADSRFRHEYKDLLGQITKYELFARLMVYLSDGRIEAFLDASSQLLETIQQIRASMAIGEQNQGRSLQQQMNRSAAQILDIAMERLFAENEELAKEYQKLAQ